MNCYEISQTGLLRNGINAIINSEDRILLHIGERKFGGSLRTFDFTKLNVNYSLLNDIDSSLSFETENEIDHDNISIKTVELDQYPSDACLINIKNQALINGKYRLKYFNKFKIIANGFVKFNIKRQTGDGNEYLGVLFNRGSIIVQKGFYINNFFKNENISTKIKNINGEIKITKVVDND